MAAPSKSAKPPLYKPPSPNAWLWWTAALLMLVTTGIVFLLRRQLPDQAVQQQIHRVTAGGTIVVGLCIICAMASRWVRR